MSERDLEPSGNVGLSATIDYLHNMPQDEFEETVGQLNSAALAAEIAQDNSEAYQ